MTLSTQSNGDLKEKEEERQPSTYSSCPYLGLDNDRDTRLAFPDEGNYCHYADPAAPVTPTHQERCCLSSEYSNCLMFDRPEGTPLPDKIHAMPQVRERQRKRPALLGLGAIILLFLLVGGFLLARGENNDAAALPVAVSASATPSPAPTTDPATATAAALALIPPTHTATSTPLPATPTTRPSATPTATATATPSPSPTTLSSATPVPPTPTPPPPQAIVNVSRVNLRNAPTTEVNNVIGLAEQGTALTIIGRTENRFWWQVCCTIDDEEAWVYFETVTVEGDTEEIPVASFTLPPAPTATTP